MLSGAENYEVMKSAVMDVVSMNFRPEFINRVDEAVVFHPLDKSDLRGIALLQLDLLKLRMAELELKFEIDDKLLNRVLEAGFDPVYGARPLKRAMQQLIENPLAENILAGKFIPGVMIRGTLKEDAAVFTVL
jgi:ATP-dependent Clp protease ATP-binding subunit ClpB